MNSNHSTNDSKYLSALHTTNQLYSFVISMSLLFVSLYLNTTLIVHKCRGSHDRGRRGSTASVSSRRSTVQMEQYSFVASLLVSALIAMEIIELQYGDVFEGEVFCTAIKTSRCLAFGCWKCVNLFIENFYLIYPYYINFKFFL